MPVDDEEFVERIRRQVTVYRRWRPWLVALYGAIAVVFVTLALWIANDAAGIVRMIGPRGFGVGVLMGLPIGILMHNIAHGLLSVLVPPRTEELMLRYHDLNREFVDEELEGDEESQIDEPSEFGS